MRTQSYFIRATQREMWKFHLALLFRRDHQWDSCKSWDDQFNFWAHLSLLLVLAFQNRRGSFSRARVAISKIANSRRRVCVHLMLNRDTIAGSDQRSLSLYIIPHAFLCPFLVKVVSRLASERPGWLIVPLREVLQRKISGEPVWYPVGKGTNKVFAIFRNDRPLGCSYA